MSPPPPQYGGANPTLRYELDHSVAFAITSAISGATWAFGTTETDTDVEDIGYSAGR